jgi:hypothetical protein
MMMICREKSSRIKFDKIRNKELGACITWNNFYILTLAEHD